MAYRCNQKVLRVPCAKYGITDPEQYLEERIGEITWDENSFAPSLAGEEYIDYILLDEVNASPLSYYVFRLTREEEEKYRPLFERIIPAIDMKDVHYCQYSWVDNTDAPDLYELDEDDDDRVFPGIFGQC